MRRVELLGLVLVAVGWIGCEAIAGLSDFGPEPEAIGGGGTTTTGGGGNALGGGGTGGIGGGTFDQHEAIHSQRFGSTLPDTLGGLDTPRHNTYGEHVLIAGTHEGNIELAVDHTGVVGVNVFLASLYGGPDGDLTARWSRSFPGATTGTATVGWLSSGLSGKSHTVGWVRAGMDFGDGSLPGNGQYDVFLAAYDRASVHQSSARWGDDQNQFALAVEAQGGGGIVGGSFFSTIDDGPWGTGGAGGAGADPFPPLSATDTTKDGFVARVDYLGNANWVTQIAGVGNEEVRAIAIDDYGAQEGGRVFVAGIHSDTAVVNGITSDHTIDHTGDGTWDAFLLVLDLTNGDYLEHRRLGGAGHIVARGLGFSRWSEAGAGGAGGAPDPCGPGVGPPACVRDLAMVGSFEGTVNFGAAGMFQSEGQSDGFVAAFSVDGAGSVDEARWARSYGGSYDDIPHAVARDGHGAVVAVGEFVGSVDFGDGPQQANEQDAFALKLDVDGALVWSGAYGGPSRDAALRVCVDIDDRVIVGGEFSQRIRLEADKLLQTTGDDGDVDIFVAMFPPSPSTIQP